MRAKAVSKNSITLAAVFAMALLSFASHPRAQEILPAETVEGTAIQTPVPAAPIAATPTPPKLIEHPVVKLQSLDKVTARTVTFEARVGSTVKFGPIYIRVQACRKAPPTEQPESASFLQIWEVTPRGESKWVYSGWMFASSPALSPMDHPIYDVWVLDCLARKSTDPVPVVTPKPETKTPDAKSADDDLSGENVELAEPEAAVVRDGELTGADAEPPKDAPPVTDLPTVTLPGE
jgi:hypothetical protein